MKKLLVLTPVPSSSASTRFRLEQFFPHLRAAGIEPVLRPFLTDAELSLLYTRGDYSDKLLAGLHAVAGRLGDLARAVRADAVLIHREAALIGPPIVEWLLKRVFARQLVFDLDDAVWVGYASPTYGALLSRLLKAPGKTNFTLSAASQVIAGNGFLADYARRYCANVDVIPTVVDTDRFVPAPEQRDVPVLGWIGTHSSAQYLRAIMPALEQLSERRRFVLRVIGGAVESRRIAIDSRDWALDREIADVQSFDIGLYPVVDDDWSRGKSGFKAVQYMACGVPFVASPVGVLRNMATPDKGGLSAANDAEWQQHLDQLLGSAPLRARLGDAGRTTAIEHWSLAAHAPRFVDIMQRALG